jgi:hypothetical protein
MAASDNLSPQQFMGVDELKTLRAGDYPGRTVGNMKGKWLADANTVLRGGGQGRHARAGGPQAYIDSLAADIREHGVQEPLQVSHHTAEDGTQAPPTLANGHHRALAAIQAGIDKVPVTHISTSAAHTEATREALRRASSLSLPHRSFSRRLEDPQQP